MKSTKTPKQFQKEVCSICPFNEKRTKVGTDIEMKAIHFRINPGPCPLNDATLEFCMKNVSREE